MLVSVEVQAYLQTELQEEENMENYSLEGDTYVIRNFDKLPPFSSFLPGLAGVKGIPLWVFYTNRGQGINSFGIHNKDNAILEFNPANTAYENTAIKGFRTFMKADGNYFEPFFTLSKTTVRNLYIRKNDITIEEINEEQGIKIKMKYFVMPEASYGALARAVQVENISNEGKSVEILDGLPKIIPYGVKNSQYKEMSNLLQSWTEIKNIDNNVPFYTIRASSDDSAEISEIEGGYFYLSIHNGQILPVIYDSEVIFGYDNSLVNPVEFMDNSVETLMKKPACYANKIPCGFTPISIDLPKGGQYQFTTLIGYTGSPEQINDELDSICKHDYLFAKEKQAEQIGEKSGEDIRTHTSSTVFDQYLEQCYLDNFLRGGYPFVFNKDKNKAVIHLFSRKHGDPERDYNFFAIAGEYYSQGNGNFRDVCQNRRNDVIFKKDVGDFNIKTFFNLIQIDGYNPLEVRPATFLLNKEHVADMDQLLKEKVRGNAGQLHNIFDKPFTPGQISNFIARHQIELNCDEDTFIETALLYCTQNIEAGFGEGYWSDHWDYTLDLIENYLKVYPDKKVRLLFGDNSYRFYDSPARVLPRSEKYVLHKNEVRQYGALAEDTEKCKQEGFNKKGTNWLMTKSGEPFETNLMVKLISLALNKFATLDPYGMGVEMEAGKPGWNDAMNGLPGIFGSGMAETLELKRLLQFICKNVTLCSSIQIPEVIYEFLVKVTDTLRISRFEHWDEFAYWDKVSSIREEYRETTRFYLNEELRTVSTQEILEPFMEFSLKLDEGIKKAHQYGEGIIPTYFTYRASDFELVLDEKDQPVISHYGLPKVRVKAFSVKALPSFLEGPAKMLAVLKESNIAEDLYSHVKKSQLYDKKLNMYKTSVPIKDLSMENGRIRAFTPGWLERESIFLHMEYKYLLSVLKAGLYDSFYEDIQTALVPFLKPEQYGRSILENSSFIASSENPNSNVHGRGYVARLSGSTTEMISMWILMFLGEKIFTYDNGELQLHFEPKLPGWMFDEKGEVSFKLLSQCNITYRNEKKKPTYGKDAAKVTKITIKDTAREVKGDLLCGKLAEDVREGLVRNLIVTME